jgi:hypothetical protein
MAAALGAGLTGSFALEPAGADFSGIVSYAFEPNPQEIKPKMYNWEIKLSQADSRNGAYEIVEIVKPEKADAKAAGAAPDVLIDSKMIGVNQDGFIDFNLHIGDKEPKQNMGRRGYSGQPIIFAGLGTAKGESSWIVFPGAKIERVVPSVKGTPLTDGRVGLIQFIVSNDRGERFQADVVLRRK